MPTTLRAITTGPVSPVEKARQLQFQANLAAKKIADDLLKELEEFSARCAEVSELTAVSPGVRDLMRRQGESITATLNGVTAIRGRE